MQLNIYEAMQYAGVRSKNTFLKRNIAFTQNGRQKLYATEDIEKAFADKKSIPRQLPDKKPTKNLQVEVQNTPPAIEIDISKHQTAFTNILQKVQEIKGDNFQHEISASLVESLIKATILETYYFEQLQIVPESRDMFQSWKQSSDLKMNISKRLGL